MTSSPDAPSEYEQVFRDELERLRQGLQLPTLGDVEPFKETCRNLVAAKETMDTADRARKSAPQDKKETANQAFEEAKKAFESADQTHMDAAKTILSDLDWKDTDIDSMVTCAIISQTTPDRLGNYASQSKYNARLMETFILSKDSAQLRRDMIFGGGARGLKFEQAMKFYTKIQRQSSHLEPSSASMENILYRLALGTALQLAVHVKEFDTPTIKVDAVERYLHYEAAYLNGELDPSFADRTIWDCRQIVNGDAPNSQLQWGRDMLKNYRPDIALLDNYVWRYCMSVRTEVGYRSPHWESAPRTYQQLISGGGRCGPRAWFARFICKAHGIPTWGARQPGHAMCHHFCPDGWVSVLGADWQFSHWEGESGLRFRLETQARASSDFFEKVSLLDCAGQAMGEKPLSLMTLLPDADSPWCSLGLASRRLIAANHQESTKGAAKGVSQVMENLRSKSEEEESTLYAEDGTIVIPAACFTKKTRSTIIMPSVLGGKQVNVRDGDILEYEIAKGSGRFFAKLRVCNVHREQKPVLITVTPSEGDICSKEIVIPYTVGQWEYTDGSVEVELGEGNNQIDIRRNTPNFGLTIKDITLTPIS